MNLRAIAIADQSFTLQDGETGFGMPVIIEDGTHSIGISEPFYCQVGRKNFEIDPDTQVAVEGNLAHVAASLSDMLAAGFDIDGNATKWLLTTADIDGTIRNYQVRFKQVDHTLGLVLLLAKALNRSVNAANEALIAQYLAAIT